MMPTGYPDDTRPSVAEMKARLRAWGPGADAALDSFLNHHIAQVRDGATKVAASVSVASIGLAIAKFLFSKRAPKPILGAAGIAGLLLPLASQAVPFVMRFFARRKSRAR